MTRLLGGRLREHRTLLAVIAVAELIAINLATAINPHDHIDGEVYQLGAKAWVAGRDLYHNLPATVSGLQLPFIYPPFAAIMFSPLAVVSKTVAITLLTIVTQFALLATLYLVIGNSPILIAAPGDTAQRRREKLVLVTLALLPLCTVSEPVLETITYAQINIVLMAMVAIDCLWRIGGNRKLPYPRGMLIGLAAGLKLTPAVFVLFLLLRKDFRSIAVSLVTFVGTVLIGAVLAFRDSQEFWLHEIFTTDRVSFGSKYPGDASMYAGNQSLRALLTRLQVPQPWLTVLLGVLGVAALALAVAGMVHAMRQRNMAMAVTINGLFGLLVSPISWSHHWVWAIPALVVLLGTALSRRDWPLLVATSPVAGFFMMGPHWKVPQGDDKELHWNVFEHLVGNSYVYCGLALLCYGAAQWWCARRRARAVPPHPAVEAPVAAPTG